MDPQLLPRVEKCLGDAPTPDVSDVAEKLRQSFREYQRKPLALFHKLVAKAVEVSGWRGCEVSTV